jgi:hypothetical protein
LRERSPHRRVLNIATISKNILIPFVSSFPIFALEFHPSAEYMHKNSEAPNKNHHIQIK